jgi:hypothetical protein
LKAGIKKMQAHGFFMLGKHGQRHCLVDGWGNPFFSLGIVHAGAYPEGEGRAIFESEYGGDWRRLTVKIVSDFKDWGFNTAGYHSPLTMLDHMPAVRDSYPAFVSYWMGKPAYPDVFDPAYQKNLEEHMEDICGPVRHHPNLIGYYWTDTPRWGLDRAREAYQTDWVSAIRSLPPSAPGKQRYAAYLLEVCKDSGEMQIYAESEMFTVEGILQCDFSGLNLNHPVVMGHDLGFLRLIARQYYRTAFEATRKADPGTLILGDRYLVGDLPGEVLEEALPYVDVISVQPVEIMFDRAFFDALHASTGKPILICDHAVNFPTEDYPETVWPQRSDEKDAALAYKDYLRALFECPYIIGYHRCQYIDRPVPGASLLKQGLLHANETPYDTLIAQIRQTNREILSVFWEGVREG